MHTLRNAHVPMQLLECLYCNGGDAQLAAFKVATHMGLDCVSALEEHETAMHVQPHQVCCQRAFEIYMDTVVHSSVYSNS